jgi:hypothetical protein
VAGLALSVTVRVPVLVPLAVGLKVTLMVQEALAATREPQVLVWEKSPLVLMLLMLSVAFPVFVSVTVWGLLVVPTAWAGKVKEVEERLAAGPVPVPVRLTVWVEGLALSVMVRVPVLVPAVVGLKVTLMAQLAPAATLEPQVLVWEKSPLILMLLMLRVALPVFVSVTLR